MPVSCDELKKLINFGKKNLNTPKRANFPKKCGWPKSRGLESLASQDSNEVMGKLSAITESSCPRPNRRKCQCDGDVCRFVCEQSAGKKFKRFSPCGNEDSLFRAPTGLTNGRPRVPRTPNLTMEEVKKRCKEIESQKVETSDDETKIDHCCSDSDDGKVLKSAYGKEQEALLRPSDSEPIRPQIEISVHDHSKKEHEECTSGNCVPSDLCRNFFCVIENIVCSFLMLISTIFQALACLISLPPGQPHQNISYRENAQHGEQHRVSKPSVDRKLGCCCHLDGTYFHSTNAFSFVVDWISNAICCLVSGVGRTSSKTVRSIPSLKTTRPTEEDKSGKSSAGKSKSQSGDVKLTASAEERAKKKTLKLLGVKEHPQILDIDNYVLTQSYLEKSVFGGQENKRVSSVSTVDENKAAPKPPSVDPKAVKQSKQVDAVPKKSMPGSKCTIGEKKTLSSSTATDNVPPLKHASTSPEKSKSVSKNTSAEKIILSVPTIEHTSKTSVVKPPSESSEKSKSESKSSTTGQGSFPSVTDQAPQKHSHRAKRASRKKSKSSSRSTTKEESGHRKHSHHAKRASRKKSKSSSRSTTKEESGHRKQSHHAKPASQEKSKSDSRSATVEESDHRKHSHHSKPASQASSSQAKAKSIPIVSTIKEESLPADHDPQRQTQLVNQVIAVPEISKSDSKDETLEESVSDAVLPRRQSEKHSESQEKLKSGIKNVTTEESVPTAAGADPPSRHSQFAKQTFGSQEKRKKHSPKKSKSASKSSSGEQKALSNISADGGQKQIEQSGPSKQVNASPEKSESRSSSTVGKKTSPNLQTSVDKQFLRHSYLGKEASAEVDKPESISEEVARKDSSISTVGDVDIVRLSNLAKKSSQMRISKSASKSTSEVQKTDSNVSTAVGQDNVRMSNIATKVSKARVKSKRSKDEGKRKHSLAKSKKAHKTSLVRTSMPREKLEDEERLMQISSSETTSKNESSQHLVTHPSVANPDGEMDYRSHMLAKLAQNKLDNPSEASSSE